MRWKIVDKERAELNKVKLLDIDESTVWLEVNIESIPRGMEPMEYIDFLRKTEVVAIEE